MVGDGKAKVGDGNEDGGAVLGHQQANQTRLNEEGAGGGGVGVGGGIRGITLDF